MKISNSAKAGILSPGRRLQYITDDRPIRRKFHQLTMDERRLVLDGMLLGVDTEWIIALIENARRMRKENAEGEKT